jgi:NAD(P)-dependent dehydrogenase (short-subunit alcohol dehydrogenase family)
MEVIMSRRIAVVTGSQKGLGFEIARQLGTQEDFNIIITARKAEDLEKAMQEFQAMRLNVDGHLLDVTNDGSVADFARWLADKYGRVDVFVNNAGVNPFLAEENSVLTAKPDVLLDTLNTNAVGMLRISQALIPMMQRSNSGRIVNVSTEMACLGLMGSDSYPVAPSYRVSKVAMNGLTVLLARELKDYNILVNAYSPGWMRTDMGGPDAPYSVTEGAQTAVYLATLTDDGPTGQFFAEMRKFGGPVSLSW